MNTENNPLTQDESHITELYRGIWWTLRNGELLPVGGSNFSEKLTTKLFLDFDAFEWVSEELIESSYNENREKFEAWFEKLPPFLRANIDAKTYFLLIALQNGIKKRLNLPDTPSNEMRDIRDRKYHSSKTAPKLSEFNDGTALCAERSALGQYLLQSSHIPSVYMSGLTFFEDPEESENHSWIVLYPGTEKALIWDIARPDGTFPNLYKNDGTISEEMFRGKENAYIKTRKLMRESYRYFWVSDHPRFLSEEFTPHVIQKVDTIISHS